MISESSNSHEEYPPNEDLIKEYINTFRHSKQSQNTRKSCLNYFFSPKYFGYGVESYIPSDYCIRVVDLSYQVHIFEIGKKDLMKYRDYLNHLQDISLQTKKIKWTILRSFLTHVEDYYEEDYGVSFSFPRIKKWNPIHKEPNSNSDVFLTIEEIQQILIYLKKTNFKYYLIFRFLAESGLRKGGVINLDYDKISLNERYVKTTEKNGRVVYYFSKELRDLLKIYMEERHLIKTDTKALFLSHHLKRFSLRQFNKYLESLSNRLGIKKNITCHVFRRSLNTLRFQIGCRDPILSILLCQKVSGVNYNNYIKKSLDYETFLGYFDQWNPFEVNNFQI